MSVYDDELADAAANLIDDLQDQLRTKEREIEDLQAELREGQVIGMALGILIATTTNCSEDEAAHALQRVCQSSDTNTRRRVAEHIIHNRGLPAPSPTIQRA